jgi:hypothetical protein
LRGDSLLTTGRVDTHQRLGNVEQRQQFRDRRDLVSDAASDFTTFAVMAHSGRDRLIAVSV